MNLEEVKARLVGRTITGIKAESWNDNIQWLESSYDSVQIVLDDGTVLDTLEEPLGVNFKEKTEG